MTAQRVTLATMATLPDLPADDAPLVAELRALGCDVRIRTWSDPEAWQEDPGVVVIRSTWDYYHHVDAFLAWLGDLEARGVMVRNPVPLIRWNARKRYLLQLAEAGLSHIPTVMLHAGDDVAARLDSLLANDAATWREAVIKPEVSGSAHGTSRLTLPPTAAQLGGLEALLAHSPLLVQPFLADIPTRGETSLLYIDGEFSHAILKRAAEGDFRVQETHGGTAEPVDATAALIGYGREVIREACALAGVAERDLLYVRVDVLARRTPHLMELEVIEPQLFLGHAPRAARRMAEAIARTAR